MCSNFDSCAILNSQAPKIFCLQNNVDFLGNSEVAFFFIHPVVLVVLNSFLKCFRDKFYTFDHLDKDMQVVRVILARERRQTNFKTSRNVGKDDT